MNIDINILKLGEATLGAVLLALVFTSLAFMAGLIKGSKSVSMGVASGIGVLTYLLNTLGGMVSWLKGYRFLSPFYHYMEPNTLQTAFPLCTFWFCWTSCGIFCCLHSRF